MNKMFIFGAGASLGAYFNSKPHIYPPIGKDLFKELKKKDPQLWNPLNEEFKKAKGDFEVFYHKIFEENKRDFTFFEKHQKSIAKLLFDYQLTPCSIYNSFLTSGLLTDEDTLVSLNYDRLLALALRDLNRNYEKVIYPHGNSSIGGEGLSGNGNAPMIIRENTVCGISVSNGTSLVVDNGVANVKHGGFSINLEEFPENPIICRYEVDKKTSSGFNYIERQRVLYNNAIESASDFFIIGARIFEHDFEHLWREILTKKDEANIFLVNPSTEQDSGFDILQRKIANEHKRVKHIPCGFEDFVKNFECLV